MLRISTRHPRTERGIDRFIYRSGKQPILVIFIEDGHQGGRIEAVLPKGLDMSILRAARDAAIHEIAENGAKMTMDSAKALEIRIRRSLAIEADSADIRAIFAEEASYKGKPDSFGAIQAQEKGSYD